MPKKKQAGSNFFDLLREGTAALRRGQTAKAVDLLERAQQLDSEHPDLILNLAGAYILVKKFNKAVTLLEPLSQREPHNPMVWTNLGAAYLGNPVLAADEHHQKAIAAFETALELNPATPNVAYNLGLIYIDRQEVDRALYWFQRAVRLKPSDRDARNYIKKLTARASAEDD